MDGHSPRALHVPLGPSRALATALVAAHAGAGAALLALPIAPIAAAAGILGLVASAVRCLRADALRRARGAAVAIGCASGAWHVCFRDGRRARARTGLATVCLPALVIVSLRLEAGARCVVVIPWDAAPAAALRRLRVALAGAGAEGG